MRSRPARLTDADLVAALDTGWSIAAASVSYLPVGAGSHHWRVEDRRDQTWFVTVDELDARRDDPRESRADVFDRLTAALAVPHALHADGADYVVAPIAERSGAVVQRLGDEWALAVYPMIDGDTFHGGQALPIADRLAVVQVIARLHRGPLPIKMSARSDEYRLQNRADLEAAIVEIDTADEVGPYSAPLARLLADHRPQVVDMLAEYDDLVTTARADNDRTVLTHGEPHAGNIIRTPAGWLLVDWDTALLRRTGTRPVASRTGRRGGVCPLCGLNRRRGHARPTHAVPAPLGPRRPRRRHRPSPRPPRERRRRRSSMGRHLPDPEPPKGRRPSFPKPPGADSGSAACCPGAVSPGRSMRHTAACPPDRRQGERRHRDSW